jgi:hypothetical protein
VRVAPLLVEELELAFGAEPALGSEPALGLDPGLDSEPALGLDPLGLDPDLDSEPALGLDADLDSEPVLGLDPDLDSEPVLAVDVVFAVDVVGEDGGLAAGAGEEAGVAAAGVEGAGAAGALVAPGAGAEPPESPFAGFGVSATAAEAVPPATPAAAVAHDADPLPGPEPHEPSSAVATLVNTPPKATVKTKARATARPIGRRFGRKPSDPKLRTDVPQSRLSSAYPLAGRLAPRVRVRLSVEGSQGCETARRRPFIGALNRSTPVLRRLDGGEILAVSAAHRGFQATKTTEARVAREASAGAPNWRANHDSQATRVARRRDVKRRARGSGWRS